MTTRMDLKAVREELAGKELVGFETTAVSDDSATVVEQARASRPVKAGAVKVGKTPPVGKTGGG